MSRQRMVKPEFFDSESLAECSVAARLCFIGLWVMGDDYGNQKAQLVKLRHNIFPYDELTADEFLGLLCELESVGCIKGYEVDGDRYITVPNFCTYQTVKKPSKSNIPEPPKATLSAKRTSVIHQWRTNVSQVAQKGCSEITVDHQCSTSDPLATLKKERKKEVVVLQQQLPKEEGAAVGAAVENSTPPSAPLCPMCKTEVKKTGMPDPDYWWCDHCQDSFPEGKAVV